MFWILLDLVGCCCVFRDITGYCLILCVPRWMLFNIVTCSWLLLDVAECFWRALDVACCCSMLLGRYLINEYRSVISLRLSVSHLLINHDLGMSVLPVGIVIIFWLLGLGAWCLEKRINI